MVPSLLILTDFFGAAVKALDYATNLAAPLAARLVLLHVRRDSILDPERFTGALHNLNSEAIKVTFNSLAKDLSVPIVSEVGHGRVVDAVADAVSRHRPTFVVLGRPDTGPVPDELVSTTSLELLRAAPYPMLVVPHAIHAAHPPRRLLLAVDGEPFALGEHALVLSQVLRALKAELTVLHVAEESQHLGASTAALDSVLHAGVLVDKPQTIRTRSVVAPHPAEGILQTAQAVEFDMVVLIARRRSVWGQLFHQSVTAQVLLHSTLPVLVLPAQE
ncbi:MAG TPA: universal stress protein [Hymenobacter sp.]|jgi:nucleotide-binding universal stress UspA family protein|uniref:universal stress protein n=1 Tax=Hymenobacter sp. TaxID=1898978 RepID=UPI002ED9EE83